jgi:dolichol-phosphate mannosyltransferase
MARVGTDSKSNAGSKGKQKKCSVVVPVYKEQENIRPFLIRTEKVLEKIGNPYEIIFVMDPSPDRTEEVIIEEINRNSRIGLLVLSRRFGQSAATMAGILSCTGDTCVIMDVDLQDPPELIEEMHKKLSEGYEVVYAKRRSRKGETLPKRIIAYVGYFVINKLSDVGIPRNTGDYRIMTRRVVEELRRLNECHGFFRGLVAYVGFKQAYVEFDRDARNSGKGNYNRLTGSIRGGMNGIISFSSRPLSMMSVIGSAIAGLSFLLGAFYVVQKLVGVNLTPGLSTTVLLITFFAGTQLLGLGLLGAYVGRIYDEVKRRPMYIVDRRVNFGGRE